MAEGKILLFKDDDMPKSITSKKYAQWILRAESFAGMKRQHEHRQRSMEILAQQIAQITKALNDIRVALPRAQEHTEEVEAVACNRGMINIQKTMKLDFQKFGGENPSGLIYKGNQYFKYSKFLTIKKI